MIKVTAIELPSSNDTNSTNTIILLDLADKQRKLFEKIHSIFPQQPNLEPENIKYDKDLAANISVILPHNLTYIFKVTVPKERLGNVVEFCFPMRAAEILTCELFSIFQQLDIRLDCQHTMRIFYHLTNSNENSICNALNFKVSRIEGDDLLCDEMIIINSQIMPILCHEHKIKACESVVRILIDKDCFDCAQMLLTHMKDPEVFEKLKHEIMYERGHRKLAANVDDANKMPMKISAIEDLIKSRSGIAGRIALEFAGYPMGQTIVVNNKEVDLGKVDLDSHMGLLSLLKEANEDRAVTPAFSAAKLRGVKSKLNSIAEKHQDEKSQTGRNRSFSHS